MAISYTALLPFKKTLQSLYQTTIYWTGEAEILWICCCQSVEVSQSVKLYLRNVLAFSHEGGMNGRKVMEPFFETKKLLPPKNGGHSVPQMGEKSAQGVSKFLKLKKNLHYIFA